MRENASKHHNKKESASEVSPFRQHRNTKPKLKMSRALTIIIGELSDSLSELHTDCYSSIQSRRRRRRRRLLNRHKMTSYSINNGNDDHHHHHHNGSRSAHNSGGPSSSSKRSLWKKIPINSRKQTHLKGAKRLTESFRARSNKLHIDTITNEIIRFKDINKFSAWLGKNEKDIIAKLDENVELVKGMRTDNFAQYREVAKQRGDLEPESCCLSLIFRDSVKTIDLIAPNKDIRDKWHDILEQHIKKQRFAKMEENFNDFLMQEFQRADLDRNGRICFNELCQLLETLNIPFDKAEARNMFELANFRSEVGDSTEEALDLDEFIDFYNSLSFTKILDKEFKALTNGGEYLEIRDLQNMFLNIQKESKSGIERYCTEIMQKYEPLCKQRDLQSTRRILCSKGFRNMILGQEFDIWDNNKMRNVYQDMSRPLTDYYYSSSHNTYLEEDQLQSRSNTETYRLYLSTGCRSVEVDMTDGDDNEPVVCHKNSLTSKLKLADVVSTIAQHAFTSSPYPIIISLENNCYKLETQRRAAQILVDGLGNLLLTVPYKSGEKQWPSPEALRGKILIKGKVLPKAKPNETLEELEERSGLAHELSELVYYGISQKLNKLQPKVSWKYNEMCSLEESVSLKFASEKSLYRRLTSEYMIKVYPFGLRINSSNFDPLPHWHCGAQMVAMNFQTKDRKMLVYDAMFRNNGGCGYILKPEYCLKEGLDSIPKLKNTWTQVQITILCALNLPTSLGSVNPYVTVKKYCPKKSQFERKFKTSVVYKNGLNPEWNEKFTFKFLKALSPLTFFRFKVSNYSLLHKNSQIGSVVIPVDLMLEVPVSEQVKFVKGHRTKQLSEYYDEKGEQARLDQCLTIIFDRDLSIDLIARNRRVRDQWFECFRKRYEHKTIRMLKDDFNKTMMKRFEDLSASVGPDLHVNDIMDLFDELNIRYQTSEVEFYYQKYFSKTKNINKRWECFHNLFESLSFTDCLDNEFHNLTGGRDFMDVDDLRRFFIETQMESNSVAQSYISDMISEWEPYLAQNNIEHESTDWNNNRTGAEWKLLTSKGFQNMLLSPEFNVWNVWRTKNIHDDMGHPMTDYYIYSSHNTYLQCNQLIGFCSHKQYEVCLSQNCRSVEIDVSHRFQIEPKVYHKCVLTKSVLLSQVTAQISECCFKTNTMPVIISLENNCSKRDVQRSVAKIFLEHFNGRLICGPLYSDEDSWPSPDQLRGRIIIKGKKLPEPMNGEDSIEKREKRSGISYELSQLIYYGTTRKLKRISDATWPYNCMASLKEDSSMKFVRECLNDYRTVTGRYMIRIYPKGIRFDSSNYDPIPHWYAGAQLVALNFQTNDKYSDINRAMFKQNGSCGYVLKPDYCRPGTVNAINYEQYRTIFITIFSVHDLHRFIPYPTLVLHLFCPNLSGDRRKFDKKFIVGAEEKDSINPEFNKTFKFDFPKHCSPLCFFRFRFFDQNNNISATIPLSLMLQGYRNIPFEKKFPGQKSITAKLIVKIFIRDND